MRNLKAALFLLAIISAAEGVLLWFFPGATASQLGISDTASGFLFASLGAASIAAAFIFVVAGFNPLANLNAIRFAILWSALMILAAIYSLGTDYVEWGHIWVMVALNLIFFISLIIFYPWKRSQT